MTRILDSVKKPEASAEGGGKKPEVE